MSGKSSIGTVSRAACVAVALLTVAAPVAQARVGGGFSVGSRGLKTFTPPPSTRTAPGATQPMQRSAQPATQASRPAVGAAQTAGASRFGGGFLGGLLGAGLLGMFLGAGFFGGLGSLFGILGFVLQIALLGWLGAMAYAWWRGRSSPAAAAAGAGYQRASLNETPMGSVAGASPAGAAMTGSLTIDSSDYASFERLLSVIQLAFGRGDQAALRSATTGEMLGYFTEQLQENAAKGVRNEIAEPKLISGDLSEAWSEANGEFATVAMRYSLLDVTVDQASGRVVAGSKTDPQDITEVWTFMRRRGGGASAWRLSAIQQVA